MLGLRGTLHLLPAAEVPLWMAANQLRFPAEERRLGKAGVDLSSFHPVVEAISDMVGPEPISRPELEQQLEAVFSRTSMSSWSVLIPATS